jgi:hypothetical protein
MGAETFSNYSTRSFMRNIDTEMPAVVICDGHTSDNGVGLIEKAEKKV